jgi:hypothetical protein
MLMFSRLGLKRLATEQGLISPSRLFRLMVEYPADDRQQIGSRRK